MDAVKDMQKVVTEGDAGIDGATLAPPKGSSAHLMNHSQPCLY